MVDLVDLLQLVCQPLNDHIRAIGKLMRFSRRERIKVKTRLTASFLG